MFDNALIDLLFYRKLFIKKDKYKLRREQKQALRYHFDRKKPKF